MTDPASQMPYLTLNLPGLNRSFRSLDDVERFCAEEWNNWAWLSTVEGLHDAFNLYAQANAQMRETFKKVKVQLGDERHHEDLMNAFREVHDQKNTCIQKAQLTVVFWE
jgi:hypothetical protein